MDGFFEHQLNLGRGRGRGALLGDARYRDMIVVFGLPVEAVFMSRKLLGL